MRLIYPNGMGFLAVWQTGVGTGTVTFIGNGQDSQNRKIRQYTDVAKFISLDTDGYVLFIHPNKANEVMTWYDQYGQEVLQWQLEKSEHGEAAAFYDDQLWFSTQMPGFWNSIYYANKKAGACIRARDSDDSATSFQPRRVTWRFSCKQLEYDNDSCLNLRGQLDQSVPPRRFGKWFIFQTPRKSDEFGLIGFHEDNPNTPQLIAPTAPWDLVKIQGDVLLCAGFRKEHNYFITMQSDSDKRHRLPGGCKAETLRIVGDLVYGWGTVGSTLNIFRFRT